jgi:hypothetical protein
MEIYYIDFPLSINHIIDIFSHELR